MKWYSVAAFLLLFNATLHPQGTDLRGLQTRVSSLGGQTATVGRQYAVMVAIDKYRNWIALRNPVNDAREIKEILARRYYISDFIELYDGEATKAGIIRLFDQLIKTTNPEDSVFIFYAGHGHLDKASNTGFWIPADAGLDIYEQQNWLPNSQIRGYISNMKARHVALASDSCFSGDILNPSRAISPEISSEYFRNAYARVSRQVLTSGASESVPDESPFARALKLALEGNTSAYLDPLMLYNEVRLGVSGTTPLFGNLKDSGHQEGASFLFFLKQQPEQTEPTESQPTAQAPRTKLTIEKTYGRVRIETKIAGKLYLDGKEQGEIPAGSAATLENVETGSHELEMQYENGSRESDIITVWKDSVASAIFLLAPFQAEEKPTEPEKPQAEEQVASSEEKAPEGPLAHTVEKTYGGVRIETKTAGELYLDGQPQGQIPAGSVPTLEIVETGSHELEMRYEDGSRELNTVTVWKDSVVSAIFLLTPLQGEPQTREPEKPQVEEQAVSSEEKAPEGPLANNEAVPFATIQIDGKFEDWNPLRPAFVNPNADKGNMGIRRAFVAKDSEYLYLKIEIADDTPSSFWHPNNFNWKQESIYGIGIHNALFGINGNVYYSPGSSRWNINVGGGPSGDWKVISNSGKYSMKGSFLEAAFPLSAFKKYVVPGNYYGVNVYSGIVEGGKFVSVDSPEGKSFRF